MNKREKIEELADKFLSNRIESLSVKEYNLIANDFTLFSGLLMEFTDAIIEMNEAEARERYEEANKFLSHETYMNGEFNRIDMAIKIASGLTK